MDYLLISLANYCIIELKMLRLDMYLNLKEAAKFVGDSSSTIIRAVTEGKLKAYKPRGRWKFKESDLIEYIECQQIDIEPDIDSILKTIKAL